MDNEARLQRALAAGAAPPRDPAFTMAVLRAAEAERYRLETARSVLRGAGLAAALASLAVPFLGWASANADALQTGALGAAGLFVAVVGVRVASSRITTVLRN
jgi:anti-sigma factor RsiW